MHYTAYMDLLEQLGERVRSARNRVGWTQAELARRAGVSVRFLVDLEGGSGNISVLRLSEVATALGVSLTGLVVGLSPVTDELDQFAALPEGSRQQALRRARRGQTIALVGLRGAGKSTVGRLLAERLGVAFVEVDAEVEAAAGMSLGEIFEYHGFGRYRELERRVLDGLVDRPEPLVLATGGSLVTAQDTWEWLRRSATTVWLRASPESHLSRVEQQGDFRPMRGRENALEELRGILATREPLYALAGLTVLTEGLAPEALADEIIRWARPHAA